MTEAIITLIHENNVMKKMPLHVLFALVSFPMLSCAASFDCSKAGLLVEKLICTDANVSNLDEELAMTYKAASDTAVDKNLLKTQQRDWLKQKRNKCGDVDCLVKTYQARIDELSLSKSASVSPSSLSPTQETWVLKSGGEYKICNLIFDLVANKYKGKELLHSAQPLSIIKGVTFPNWEEISQEDNIKIVNPNLLTDPKAISIRKESSKKYPNRKYYRARVNYDNYGDDEYILQSNLGDPEREYAPAYSILIDKNTLYPSADQNNYGRLFLYEGRTHILWADPSSFFAVRIPQHLDDDRLVFSLSTYCRIELVKH